MIEFPYAFNFNGERLFIEKTNYYNQRVAFEITDSDLTPYAVLTINLPDVRLEEGEFIVKTWAENEDIANCIRELGIFEETSKRVRTGFCVAEIWKLRQGSAH
jgi:hypothetical protein